MKLLNRKSMILLRKIICNFAQNFRIMKEKFKTRTMNGHEEFKTASGENFYVDVTKDDFPLFNPKGKFTCVVVHLLLVLWMLPQSLLGLLFAIFTRWRYIGYCGGAFYFKKSGTSSVSLGYFIFVSDQFFTRLDTASHEYGHHINSRWSGWLYLFIIGMPSIIACAVMDSHKRYLMFYPEKWAEKFGKMYFPKEEYTALLIAKK